MIRRFLSLVSVLASLCLAMVAISPTPAHAQLDSGLQEVGSEIGLSAQDPRVIVVRIINIFLGTLGIIFLVLVLYAGFLWMTAGGDSAQVDKAKKIIKSAIIGLVIIFLSWAITKFVFEKLLGATGDGGGSGISDGSGGGSGGGFGGSKGVQFQTKSISPSGSVPLKNVEVKVVFTKLVDEKTVGAITVEQDGGSVVPGSLVVQGTVVYFTPEQVCPAPNQALKCFDGNADFTVKIGSALKSSQGEKVFCSASAPCSGTFHTGDLVDTTPPSVQVSFPTDGMSIPVNSLQNVQATANDDSGIALIDFLEGASSFGIEAPAKGDSPKSFSASLDWDTAGVSLGEHFLSASAADLDKNVSKSGSVSVVVRPPHCFNEKQDADKGETGIDCGGDPKSLEYCGACMNDSCSKNADCSSGFCDQAQKKCVAQPVISSVSPLDGKPGTFVTLQGANFGLSTGEVVFMGNPADAGDDVVAKAPQVCLDAGSPSWGNTQVVVAVPEGAVTGPLRLKNASNGLTDQTDDAKGPKIPDFQKNDKTYPGLCALVPKQGTVGTQVNAIGQGFGSVQGKVLFSGVEINGSSWKDASLDFKVPVANSGPNAVVIKTAEGESNAVNFLVEDKALGAPPILSAMDPENGPKQEYVTLFGKNFGYNPGYVVFTDPVQQLDAIADTKFPAVCGKNSFWKDESIVVKVPSSFAKQNLPVGEGTYQVKVVRQQDNAASNELPFTITAVSPKPGICAVEPAVGPEKTVVKLFGERLAAEKPQVFFDKDVQASVDDDYSNEQVITSVPKFAVTGPLVLKTQGQSSNKVNFQVMNCNAAPQVCGPADQFQCCASGECLPVGQKCGAKSLTAQFAWQMSTGLIPTAPYVIEECRPDLKPMPTPSPSPWLGRAGGDQAPVDSAILMRFSTLLDDTTVSGKSSNFRLYKCTDGGSDPCKKTESVSYGSPILINDNVSQQSVVKLDKNFKLDKDTTYLVNVSASVRAAGKSGTNMAVMKSCGAGPNGEAYGYCFRFKTRNSDETSKVEEVVVIPPVYNLYAKDEKTKYLANPVNSADKCINVECNLYDWNWHTGVPESDQDTDSRATISKEPDSAKQACVQTATAVQETGPDVPVGINAKLLQSQSVIGKANLFITFLPPQVVNYSPNCDETCRNAVISVDFNQPIDEASASLASNLLVYECANENCNSAEFKQPIPVTGVVFSDEGKNIQFETVPDFQVGAFYHVTMRGGPGVANGIKGKNGVPLAGLNEPQGFGWNFRIRQNGADCVAERIDMVPVRKIEKQVGASQLFVATPVSSPDKCSSNGQALKSKTAPQWSVADAKVATLYKNGTVNTSGKLPLGCSGKCILTGSVASVQSQPAICGNNIIETTDAKFCVGGVTPAGDACKVLPPGAKGAEECEPKNGVLSGKCDVQTCLIVTDPKSASCGNGVIESASGEQCDFGPTCVGGSKAAKNPVPEESSCLTLDQKESCKAAGGTCDMHAFQGCSVSCKFLGSPSGKSVCGNGNIGYGEACDDGNTNGGDGCSALCLHEGSQTSQAVYAVCGNGKKEPGEACEAKLDAQGKPVFSSGCDQKTCLNTGKIACLSGKDANCCGNGKIESGEDCDDVNHASGDGCSSSCLAEGSSPYYLNANGTMSPSFCGNGGLLEKGEQCEAPAALAGKVDRAQLATIVGKGTPDIDGLMKTDLSAALEGQTGKAEYGVQCGYTDELSCPSGYGLDDAGCCRARPKVVDQHPLKGSQGVCRNVQVSGVFNVAMRAASVTNNFYLLEPAVNNVCAPGTTEAYLPKTYAKGFRGGLAKAWDRVVSWFTGEPAYAAKWCKGAVTGNLQALSEPGQPTNEFAFTLDKALKPETDYRVLFVGDDDMKDNADKLNRKGVMSEDGVIHAAEIVDNGELSWTFKTGKGICGMNKIQIYDVTKEEESHPFLFTNIDNKPETRSFQAVAMSLQSGTPQKLSPVEEYAWIWNYWTSSEQAKGIVSIASAQGVGQSGSSSIAKAVSGTKNGSSILTSSVTVVSDKVNDPTTVGDTVEGNAPVMVMACHNPWPSLKTAPFRDMQDTPTIADIQNAIDLGNDPYQGKFYNFMTAYCRDAGSPELTSDDLPNLGITLVPLTALDKSRGILRQYLFTYAEPEYKQDGIGVRIIQNPFHYSPEEWYRLNGFTGNPTSLTVDGYPAVRDGATVYIAATSRGAGAQDPIYSNIYVFSYNPNATAVTENIFKQILEMTSFNINITAQSNVCVEGSAQQKKIVSLQTVGNGAPIACSTDWDCLKFGKATFYCDSTKAKLIRDTERLVDFQGMSRRLDTAKANIGKYPEAKGGTYLPGTSVSTWSSWQPEVGAVIAGAPTDPINRLIACGRCEKNTELACQTSSDCPTGQACKGGIVSNGQWKQDDSIDPQSCWNKANLTFTCPRYGDLPTGASRVYQYRAVNSGDQYELGAEFEIPPTDTPGTWWTPPLPQGIFRCTNPGAEGRLCTGENPQGDKECRPCTNPLECKKCQNGGNECTADSDCSAGDSCKDVVSLAGSCRPSGGVIKYKDICLGQAYGQAGSCGDGVLNPGEACEIGQTKVAFCSINGKGGYKQQVCLDCKGFKDDLKDTTCYPQNVCGNGKTEKAKQGGGTSEVCDDGSLNGTYAHCNATCTGYAAFCGDGKLSPGEICDNGVVSTSGKLANGAYGSSCSLDCKGVGPFCGDNDVNGSEQCDGNSETTTSALCYGGTTDGKLCAKDADCGGGGKCGGGPVKIAPSDTIATGAHYQSCVGVTVKGKDGAVRTTQHVKSCNPADPSSSAQCQFTKWSQCTAVGICGDGQKDAGEECDDGSGNGDTKACTLSCKKNSCGDGKVNQGVEECDAGANNGKAICNAEYGSSCLSCGNSCKFLAVQGGYCGDKVKNGAEQCDGPVDANITCTSLGYDFSTNAGDKPTCSNSCGFAGCARCSDTIGDGKIEAYVYDAVYQQVVPNARVTLMHKGVKSDEVYTDADGKFSFKTLNKNAACTQYRLVIDMYQDNPCTGANPTQNCRKGIVAPWKYPQNIDEGATGGYFPFESDVFSYGAFSQKFGASGQEPAHVNIFPRPNLGIAYAAMTWEGVGAPARLDMLLPEAYAFAVQDFTQADGEGALCTYSARPASPTNACSRTVGWRSIGFWSIDSQAPYARHICIHRPGEKSGGNTNPVYNGCPLEGTDACYTSCMEKPAANEQSCKDQCGLGKANQGGDGKSVCASYATWEDCFSVNYSPITTIVNYQQYTSNGTSQPIVFVVNGAQAFAQKKGKAYLVTREKLIELKAPSGAGNYLKLGELAPTTGFFSVPDPLKPQAADFHNIGQGCYSYPYQCAGDNYCVKGGTVQFPCYQVDSAAQCASIGGTCQVHPETSASQAAKIPAYHYYNW